MTTTERERMAPFPPVKHREGPPAPIPPTPSPKVGGLRWLWWLAAMAAAVIGTTAVVLLLEDDEPAYVNAETYGPPGVVLEAWVRSPQMGPSLAASNAALSEFLLADVAMLNSAQLDPLVRVVSEVADADVAMLNSASVVPVLVLPVPVMMPADAAMLNSARFDPPVAAAPEALDADVAMLHSAARWIVDP